MSNVFDSLITAGNSFQIVGAVKLKECLLKLVVRKGIDYYVFNHSCALYCCS